MLDSERYRDHAADCLKTAAKVSSDSWSYQMQMSMHGVWIALAIEDEAMNAMIAKWGIGAPIEATLVPD